jgi:LPXTG-motif cell wall-anchored protein
VTATTVASEGSSTGSGSLPLTGSGSGRLVLFGAGLVGLGVLLARRRRSAH